MIGIVISFYNEINYTRKFLMTNKSLKLKYILYFLNLKKLFL